MLELYQFEFSQFSEKVRLILDYKGLAYRKIEVVPGMGQLELMRMSGQRQVPVLKDGNTIIPLILYSGSIPVAECKAAVQVEN